MQWLIFIALAVFFDSLRIFTDNYICDEYYKEREVAAQKMFSAYAKTIISIIILFILGFNYTDLGWEIISLMVISGILASIAEIPYYLALGVENSTNLGIFIQFAPVLYLILGWIFLGDTFSPIQLLAILVILMAPLLIVIKSRKRSRNMEFKAIAYAFCYIFVAVISTLIFAKANGSNTDIHLLFEGISLAILGTGIADMAIMQVHPKWRKRYRYVKKASKNKVLLPLSLSLIAGIITSFFYRVGIVTAPAVALASATFDSAEPVVIFFMGIILTLIWPKFGREKLDKNTIITYLIATVLIVIGIILMQL